MIGQAVWKKNALKSRQAPEIYQATFLKLQPDFFLGEAEVYGQGLRWKGKLGEVQPLQPTMRITKDSVEMVEHDMHLPCLIHHSETLVPELLDKILATMVAGSQMKEPGVHVTLLEKDNS
jgi:hypothetical protein